MGIGNSISFSYRTAKKTKFIPLKQVTLYKLSNDVKLFGILEDVSANWCCRSGSLFFSVTWSKEEVKNFLWLRRSKLSPKTQWCNLEELLSSSRVKRISMGTPLVSGLTPK